MGAPPHSIAIHGKPPTRPPPPTANPNLGRWRFAVDFLDQNNVCKTGAKGSYAKLKTTVYSLKFGFHSFKRRQSPFQAIIVISFFNSQFYVFPDLLAENKLEAFFVIRYVLQSSTVRKKRIILFFVKRYDVARRFVLSTHSVIWRFTIGGR